MTGRTARDLLAEVIWKAPVDEGTISAAGAYVITDAILASPALDAIVAERVAAIAELVHRFERDASRITDHEGNLVGYAVTADQWRAFRATITDRGPVR